MKIHTFIETIALVLSAIFIAGLAAIGLVWLVVQIVALIYVVL